MKGYELKEHRRLTISQLHKFSRLEERRVIGAVEDLVEVGVVKASGSGVSRSYILSSKVYKADDALPAYVRQNNISSTRQRGMVLELAEKNGGEVTSSEVMDLLGLSYISAYCFLKKMERANFDMRAKGVHRDISSRERDMPTPEYRRPHNKVLDSIILSFTFRSSNMQENYANRNKTSAGPQP